MKEFSKRELTMDKLRLSVQSMILQSTWSEVGVQDIAQMANVSIGTFYNYFESKDAALEDLKKVLSQVLYQDLNAVIKTESDPIDQLTLLIKYFFKLIEDKHVWAKYLLGGASFSERLEPSVSHIIYPILQAGCEKESFLVQINSVVIELIEKGLFGLLCQALMQKNTPDDVDSQCAELILKMVGVPPLLAQKTAQRTCPCTPLSLLPVSALSLGLYYDESNSAYV